MARKPDAERRRDLLDEVVAYLAEHGLADVSLRPLAHALGVSVNALAHHFGTKDELVIAALQRSVEQQAAVQAGWLAGSPKLTQADLLRRWWRWINASPANLAIVRLGLEAASLDATVTGLPGPVRADQIGVWRAIIEDRLVAEGLPSAQASIEASLVKAAFTGLIVDLLATGDRRRLTKALDLALDRLEHTVRETTG